MLTTNSHRKAISQSDVPCPSCKGLQSAASLAANLKVLSANSIWVSANRRGKLVGWNKLTIYKFTSSSFPNLPMFRKSYCHFFWTMNSSTDIVVELSTKSVGICKATNAFKLHDSQIAKLQTTCQWCRHIIPERARPGTEKSLQMNTFEMLSPRDTVFFVWNPLLLRNLKKQTWISAPIMPEMHFFSRKIPFPYLRLRIPSHAKTYTHRCHNGHTLWGGIASQVLGS